MDVRSDYNLSISSFLSPCTEIFDILDGKYQDLWRYYMSSEIISWYSFQQYFGFPKVAMCFDGTLIRVWESDQNPILQMQPSPRWTLLLSSWIIEQTKIHDYFFHNIIDKWNPDMSKYDSLSFSMKLPYLSFSLGFNQFGKFGSI